MESVSIQAPIENSSHLCPVIDSMRSILNEYESNKLVAQGLLQLELELDI